MKFLQLLQDDLLMENWEKAFQEYFTEEDVEVIENELSMLLSATILYRIFTGIYEVR